jgi:hypothetical protein
VILVKSMISSLVHGFEEINVSSIIALVFLFRVNLDARRVDDVY